MAIVDFLVAVDHDALRLNYSGLTLSHAAACEQLAPEASQYGHAQLFLEYSCALCFLAEALDVASTLRSCTKTVSYKAAFFERSEKVWCVGHESRGFLEQVSGIGLLAKLALVGDDSINASFP